METTGFMMAAGDITVNIFDLLLYLLVIAGIVALVFLVIVFIRLGKTLKKVNLLIDDVQAPVTETIKNLPAISENVSGSMVNVKNVTDVVNDVVTDVGDVVDSFVSPDGPTGVIASVAGAVVSVIQIVREMNNK